MSIEQLESALGKIELNDKDIGILANKDICILANKDICILANKDICILANKDIGILANKDIPFNKILYYSLKITIDPKTFSQPVEDPLIINKEFHITMLYTGKKFNTNSEQFNEFLGKEAFVEVHSYAVSDSYIVLCVGRIYSNDHMKIDFPYFGNPIKHITYAVKRGSKPVNSPSAFTYGRIYKLEIPLLLNGILDIVVDNTHKK
jgi:hypothetical protein